MCVLCGELDLNAGHCKQAETAVVSEYFPAGQSRQGEFPTSALKLPAEHAVQLIGLYIEFENKSEPFSEIHEASEEIVSE
jgi:hypothetical protein